MSLATHLGQLSMMTASTHFRGRLHSSCGPVWAPTPASGRSRQEKRSMSMTSLVCKTVRHRIVPRSFWSWHEPSPTFDILQLTNESASCCCNPYCPLSLTGNTWEQLNVNGHKVPHWTDNSWVLHLQGGRAVPNGHLRGRLLAVRSRCRRPHALWWRNLLSSWASCLCLDIWVSWLYN